jgi:hypothetical protein
MITGAIAPTTRVYNPPKTQFKSAQEQAEEADVAAAAANLASVPTPIATPHNMSPARGPSRTRQTSATSTQDAQSAHINAPNMLTPVATPSATPNRRSTRIPAQASAAGATAAQPDSQPVIIPKAARIGKGKNKGSKSTEDNAPGTRSNRSRRDPEEDGEDEYDVEDNEMDMIDGDDPLPSCSFCGSHHIIGAQETGPGEM